MSNIILRLPAIKNKTGLSRSAIYSRIAKNTFPKQITLGGRAVGWIEQEIDEWIIKKIAQSKQNQSKVNI